MSISNDCVLIITCGALSHDLVKIKNQNRWKKMEIQCLPPELHNRPQSIPEAVTKKIHKNKNKYRKIFVAYADCGTGGLLDAVLKKEGVERLPGAHCYEIFAGSKQFNYLHKNEIGTFYLTDFLVRHFDRLIIKGLGLDRYPELKDQYFNHYKKLVYLAQTNNDELSKKSKKIAENYFKFEYQRIYTGESFLEKEICSVLTNRDV